MPEHELDPMAEIMSQRLLDPSQHKLIRRHDDGPGCASCGFDLDEHRPDFVLPWKRPAPLKEEVDDDS